MRWWLTIHVLTAKLMWRVWRLHRATGIPYDTLLEAHLQMVQQRARSLREALIADIAARN